MAAFWSLRGHHTEGRQRLAEMLALVPGESVARVSALNGAGWLALDQGDYAEASGLFGEGIGLAQALGDTVGEGIGVVYLGRCKLSSLQIAEAVPDVERAAALLSQTGDRPAIALTTFYSALAALLTGRPEAACDLFARCAADAASLGLVPLTARARAMLGYPLLDRGDVPAARAALAEGIPLAAQVGDRWFVQIGLGACIGLAVKTGRPRLALRLAGAADAYRDTNEFSLPVPIAEIIDRWLAPARASAGAAAGRLIAEGRRLTPEEAVELALRSEPEEARAAGTAPDADPPRSRGRDAGGPRPDQPGDRRAAVPLGPHRRGACRSHPHQAGATTPAPSSRPGLTRKACCRKTGKIRSR